MFTRTKTKENIIKKLTLLQYYVKYRSKQMKFDINKDCEDFFAELFNFLWNLELTNLNKEEKNHPAVDLGDKDNGIAIQITSSNEKRKIDDTIQKFESKKLHEKYPKELIIFIIGEKKDYRKEFNCTGVSQVQIKDYYDILDEISNLSGIEALELEKLINDLLDNQFFEILSGSDTYKVKKRKVRLAKNAKSFITDYLDLNINSNEGQQIKKDLDVLAKRLSKISSKSRTLLISLIEIRKEEYKDNIYFFLGHVSQKIGGSKEEQSAQLSNLMEDNFIIPEKEVYDKNGAICIYQEICYKDIKSFNLAEIIDFCELNNRSLNDLILKLDFTVLD